ncbi:MAG TPA: hypothetical protein VFJ74_16645 [Gemmatimonadaceae bacterium]|nr:hypothetical protein [Gemmatimonadaceae bacterium]
MGSMLRAAPALPPSFSLHSAVAAAAGRRALSPLVAALCAAAVGCAPSQNAAAHESDTAAAAVATATSSPALSADSVLAVADTQTGAVTAGPTPQGEPTLPSQVTPAAARAARRPAVTLSPLADTIAGSLVFAPRTQQWFAAATRGRRMLIDLGRVDTDVKKTPERLAAYKEAVAARSIVAPDARFRLHGVWGVEEVTIGDYDVWNGRIVGVAHGSETIDSLAQRTGPKATPVTAVAELVAPPTYAAAGSDSATAAPADSGAASTTTTVAATPLPTRCVRDSASTPLATRAAEVRDSLDLLLRQTAMPPYEEVARTVTIASSQVIGCFLPAAVAAAPNAPPRPAATTTTATSATATPARGLVLAVSLRDAEREFLRERVVLIDDATGAVTPLRVADLRFKAHDLIAAYDADGDGVDDLAAKGVGEATGATVVLRFEPKTKKFLRLASGFAWESR